MKQSAYFLGANTPLGFCGFGEELLKSDDGRILYLIKGGPGTGKSSLMKRWESVFVEKGYQSERIYCSSDPDSLDGVLIPEKRLGILDATAPHILEPRYWGVTERIVDLSACLHVENLWQEREDIFRLTNACGGKHKEVCRCLSDAVAACGDISEDDSDREIAADILRHFPKTQENQTGKRTRRFLSAVTPKGFIGFPQTVKYTCDTVYKIISDKPRNVVSLVLKEAQNRGADTIECPSPLFPGGPAQFGIIPSWRVGILLCGKNDPPEFSTISGTREYRIGESDGRMNCDAIKKAIIHAKEAKEIHDRLERYYTEQMNWERYETIVNGLMKETAHF